MCTRPLKGFIDGERENGKKRIIVRSYNVDHLEVTGSGSIISCFDKSSNLSNRPIRDFIEIPCGKCLECRLNYSRSWANRCMLESMEYDENCFITLTYNENNIPVVEDVNPVTGELQKFKTLVKEDFQKFMKRLRKELSKDDLKIRFFAAGEYGEHTKRPHYHAIIFGWKPSDLTPLSRNLLGNTLYKSDFLDRVWQKGNCVVGDVTYESCSYVARYCTKKVDVIKNNNFGKMKILPEFTLMSRKPGIGLNWFNKNSVCYAIFTNNYIKTKNGSQTITPNRYFDSQLEKLDPEKFKEIKEKRKEFAEEKKKVQMSQTSLPYLEALKVVEENLKNKTKVLQRKEI